MSDMTTSELANEAGRDSETAKPASDRPLAVIFFACVVSLYAVIGYAVYALAF